MSLLWPRAWLLLVLLLALRPLHAAAPLAEAIAQHYQPGDVLLLHADRLALLTPLDYDLAARLPQARIIVQRGRLAPPPDAPRLLLVLPPAAPEEASPPLLAGRYARLARHALDGATLVIYRQTPAALQPLARFGESVVLLGWHLHRPARVQPCAVLALESWWRIEAPVPQDYSLTFVLNTAAGDGLARSDGPPAGSQMRLWPPGDIVIDERTLTVPCDAPPGEYFLALGVYDWADGQSLPVQPDAGPRAALMALRLTDD
jgi:hypothetical protein